MTPQRQPTFFLTHGAGPCFWMDFPALGPGAFDSLRAYFAGLLASLPQKPDAILVMSAHWETEGFAVSAAAKPGMIYDYTGFPEHTYQLSHPAPGSPALAQTAQRLLKSAGLATELDAVRGFDHGVFVPMMIVNPLADIPTVSLSVQRTLDPATHIAAGAALAPLRDSNILIIGSGSSYHNLRDFFAGSAQAAEAFDGWLDETITLTDAAERHRRLINWADAPGGQASHPRAEHLIPLLTAAGAGSTDMARRDFHALIGNKPFACFRFG